MKNGIFYLLILAGLAWTTGCGSSTKATGTKAMLAKKSGKSDSVKEQSAPIAGDPDSHLEPGTAPVSEQRSVDQARKDSLLADAMEHALKQKKYEFTGDSLSTATVNELDAMSDTLQPKNAKSLSGRALSVFAAQCWKKRANGAALNPLEKAVLESHSIDSILVEHQHVRVVYKPLTGLQFIETLLGQKNRGVEKMPNTEEIIALQKTKKRCG